MNKLALALVLALAAGAAAAAQTSPAPPVAHMTRAGPDSPALHPHALRPLSEGRVGLRRPLHPQEPGLQSVLTAPRVAPPGAGD